MSSSKNINVFNFTEPKTKFEAHQETNNLLGWLGRALLLPWYRHNALVAFALGDVTRVAVGAAVKVVRATCSLHDKHHSNI